MAEKLTDTNQIELKKHVDATIMFLNIKYQ